MKKYRCYKLCILLIAFGLLAIVYCYSNKQACHLKSHSRSITKTYAEILKELQSLACQERIKKISIANGSALRVVWV